MSSDPEKRLLPPDGVAWPPEPEPPVVVAPSPTELATVARRPAGADIDDWRAMPLDAPDGYLGSATAPPRPVAGVDQWSVASFVLALVGVLPFMWTVPLASVLAVGCGVAGRRVCSLDPTRQGKAFATVGLLLGAATLVGIAGAVAAGSFSLFG